MEEKWLGGARRILTHLGMPYENTVTVVNQYAQSIVIRHCRQLHAADHDGEYAHSAIDGHGERYWGDKM